MSRDDALLGLRASPNRPVDGAVFRGRFGKGGGGLGDRRHGDFPIGLGGVERKRQTSQEGKSRKSIQWLARRRNPGITLSVHAGNFATASSRCQSESRLNRDWCRRLGLRSGLRLKPGKRGRDETGARQASGGFGGFVPKGHFDNSPAFRRRVTDLDCTSPGGTAEYQACPTCFPMTRPSCGVESAVPPGLEACCMRPGVETPGYSHRVPSGQPERAAIEVSCDCSNQTPMSEQEDATNPQKPLLSRPPAWKQRLDGAG